MPSSLLPLLSLLLSLVTYVHACALAGQVCANTGDCCSNSTFTTECNATTLVCQATPCGVCPCVDAPCVDNSSCCSPYYFTGQSSLCVPVDNASFCAWCGFRAEGDLCNFDYECDCNGTSLVCREGEFTPFTFCLPPAPAPTPPPTPPYGPNCTNQSQCSDTQYCSPDLGLCVTCAGFFESCEQDPPSQCNCTSNATAEPMFCHNITRFGGLGLRCVASCAAATDCPADAFCDATDDLCKSCNFESAACCNATVDCGSDDYVCSETRGYCVPCVELGGDCFADPAVQCGCGGSTNVCVDDVCVAPGAPPNCGLWCLWIPVSAGITFGMLICCCCFAAALWRRRRCPQGCCSQRDPPVKPTTTTAGSTSALLL